MQPAFVKLTDANSGEKRWVNLNLVTDMLRLAPDRTRLFFPMLGVEDHVASIDVVETPTQILELLG
jgi:hypothetical protein